MQLLGVLPLLAVLHGNILLVQWQRLNRRNPQWRKATRTREPLVGTEGLTHRGDGQLRHGVDCADELDGEYYTTCMFT